MWVFTKDGFFSAVKKSEQKGTCLITIRARARNDLVNAKKAMGLKRCKIISNGGTDYEFRMVVKKEKWANYLFNQTMALDYENFKGKIYEISPKRESIYGRVWAELLDIAAKNKPWGFQKKNKDVPEVWFDSVNY